MTREAGEIAREALKRIDETTCRPFPFPEDWLETVRACPDCKRFASHPVMHGVCNEHHRPLHAREEHDREERRLLYLRRLEVAQEALRQIALSSEPSQ